MLKALFMIITSYGYAIFSTIFIIPIISFLKIVKILTPKKAKSILQKNSQIWAKILFLGSGSKLEIIYENKEELVKIKDEGIIIISNHQSKIDIPLLLGYFVRPIGFVAKKELQGMPILSWWMNNLDCIYLDRSNPRSAIKTMKEGAKLISENKACVSIFPEGTRGPEIKPFKKGSFKIAFMAKAYIVPVTIKGTEKISSSDKMKAGKIQLVKMHIGTPISTKNLSKQEKENLIIKIEQDIIGKFSQL